MLGLQKATWDPIRVGVAIKEKYETILRIFVVLGKQQTKQKMKSNKQEKILSLNIGFQNLVKNKLVLRVAAKVKAGKGSET